MYASILNITFDCADARAQATFWAAATGWTAQERDATPGHVEYAVEPPSPGGPRLYFTTVPEPKTVKNRIHLDLLPPGDDQQKDGPDRCRYSGNNGGNCVEVARNLPGAVALRDSKDTYGPVLVVTPDEWQAFTTTVKAGALGLR